MLLRLVICVGDRGLSAFRFPLLRAGGALRQLPFVLEQDLEEVVAPFRRCLRPGHFRATGDGVGAEADAMLALPAEALIAAPSGSTPISDGSPAPWVLPKV